MNCAVSAVPRSVTQRRNGAQAENRRSRKNSAKTCRHFKPGKDLKD